MSIRFAGPRSNSRDVGRVHITICLQIDDARDVPLLRRVASGQQCLSKHTSRR